MKTGTILKIDRKVLPNFRNWDYRYRIIEISNNKFNKDDGILYKIELYNAGGSNVTFHMDNLNGFCIA